MESYYRVHQAPKFQRNLSIYRFPMAWPASVQDVYPTHTQVLAYLKSYAQHFGIISYIKFNSKVIYIDYVGETFEEMESWDLWGVTSKPFHSKGKWHIVVQDTLEPVWYMCLNTCFQFLNNITRIFIYFFTHTYF